MLLDEFPDVAHSVYPQTVETAQLSGWGVVARGQKWTAGGNGNSLHQGYFFHPQTVTSKEYAFPLYGHILSSKTDVFPHVLLEWLLVQVCEQVVALLEVTEDSVC